MCVIRFGAPAVSAALSAEFVLQVISCPGGVAFWKPAENPRTRPLRSWAFDAGCAIAAGAASLAHFSFGQAGHASRLSLAAWVIVAVVTAAALPARRAPRGAA